MNASINPSINPQKDVLDIFNQLSLPDREDVLMFAKFLQGVEILGKDSASFADDWEKTPQSVKAVVAGLVDRYVVANKAYKNLLEDWSGTKNDSRES